MAQDWPTEADVDAALRSLAGPPDITVDALNQLRERNVREYWTLCAQQQWMPEAWSLKAALTLGMPAPGRRD